MKRIFPIEILLLCQIIIILTKQVVMYIKSLNKLDINANFEELTDWYTLFLKLILNSLFKFCFSFS